MKTTRPLRCTPTLRFISCKPKNNGRRVNFFDPNSDPNSCNIETYKRKERMHLPLPRVDIPASTHLETATLLVSLARQNTRQIVLVHEVPLLSLSTSLLGRGSHILFLVFSENKLGSPSAFATAAFPFPVGATGDRLGNTVAVAAGVPCHVLLEVHCELAVGVCGAGDTRECVLSAARTELLVHVFGGEEAAVAALDEGLEVADPLQGGSGE